MPATQESELEASLALHFPARAVRVLDCACGPPVRTAALRAHGASEIVGLARDAVLAGPAATHYDRVLMGNPFSMELPFEPDQFDCILCHDVLARLRDPEPFLQRLYPLLSDAGTFVVTAPNIQYHRCFVPMIEGHWEYTAEGPLARAHLRFFTGSELLRLLQRIGFQVERTSALAMDPPDAFPRAPDGFVHLGRMDIGPLNDNEYKQYLVREFVFTAKRTVAAPERVSA
ncbi:MAG: class I SAM-dependent methyltransferase [Candidatus Hydrogenedentes bacterium]|nr:class I SAM-dependent methyltransferase [Candidatus Hydrogenedentota bacterium]